MESVGVWRSGGIRNPSDLGKKREMQNINVSLCVRLFYHFFGNHKSSNSGTEAGANVAKKGDRKLCVRNFLNDVVTKVTTWCRQNVVKETLFPLHLFDTLSEAFPSPNFVNILE